MIKELDAYNSEVENVEAHGSITEKLLKYLCYIYYRKIYAIT